MTLLRPLPCELRSCYWFSDDQLDHQSASDACLAMGSTLVHIDDAAENSWIAATTVSGPPCTVCKASRSNVRVMLFVHDCSHHKEPTTTGSGQPTRTPLAVVPTVRLAGKVTDWRPIPIMRTGYPVREG